MGLAQTALLRAAGHCLQEEPLFAVEDAWDYVIEHVAAHARATPDATDNNTGSAQELGETVRLALQRARDADMAHRLAHHAAHHAAHCRCDDVRTAESNLRHVVASGRYSSLSEAIVTMPTETVREE